MTATVEPDLPAESAGGMSKMLKPRDSHNERLENHTHPPRWSNPTPSGRYNMVVVGAGPAGLVAAAGAAGLGAKVALVERGLMGGDCLNVGCVPSKALIRSARAAADLRHAGEFGIRAEGAPHIDFPAVMERMRRLRADLARHDSAERFSEMGIDVFLGSGAFSGPDTIVVSGATLTFSRALIATGARAAAPPLEGLEEAGYLTNETVFSLTELPPRLAVIGAGPIGCELAQAFARLGAEVTLIEAAERIMPREGADAAKVVQEALVRDGVRVVCGGKVARVRKSGAEKILRLNREGEEHEVHVDEILVGVGRKPNVESLNLPSAQVEFDTKTGVHVNDYLQTSNPKIYAAGDVASAYKFTHAADAMARIVLRNALFFGRARASALTVPWCTYTDPEVAHAGISEEEVERSDMNIETITVQLDSVDRAVVDGETVGFLRVHLKKGSDRILGATLVARHAGDMISEITTVMAAGKGLSAIGDALHPYPTQSEIMKKAADAYARGKLTPLVKRLFTTVLSWRR